LTVLYRESIFGLLGSNNSGGSQMRRHVCAVLAILVSAVLVTWAGVGWVDKDWKQWSKDEVKLVLHDSPWSKKWAKGQLNTSAAVPGVSGAGKEGAAGENAPEIDYYLQIRSAMPVREAVIREAQLERGYDSFTESEKKAFDAQSIPFLNRVYSDVIVVHVLFSSNVQAFERQLAEHWQNIRTDAIPDEVFLINERGNRVPPVRFTAPRGGAYEFDLAFPRTLNGDAVIHEGDKTFQIEFINPAVGTQATRTPESNGSPATVSAGGATARKPGSNGGARTPLPPTGSATSPTNHAVANFKAERVLVEFNVASMMWQGRVTY
jgi:hypothetical protein